MGTLHQNQQPMETGPLDMPALIRTLSELTFDETMDERADMTRKGSTNSRRGKAPHARRAGVPERRIHDEAGGPRNGRVRRGLVGQARHRQHEPAREAARTRNRNRRRNRRPRREIGARRHGIGWNDSAAVI